MGGPMGGQSRSQCTEENCRGPRACAGIGRSWIADGILSICAHIGQPRTEAPSVALAARSWARKIDAIASARCDCALKYSMRLAPGTRYIRRAPARRSTPMLACFVQRNKELDAPQQPDAARRLGKGVSRQSRRRRCPRICLALPPGRAGTGSAQSSPLLRARMPSGPRTANRRGRPHLL